MQRKLALTLLGTAMVCTAYAQTMTAREIMDEQADRHGSDTEYSLEKMPVRNRTTNGTFSRVTAGLRVTPEARTGVSRSKPPRISAIRTARMRPPFQDVESRDWQDWFQDTNSPFNPTPLGRYLLELDYYFGRSNITAAIFPVYQGGKPAYPLSRWDSACCQCDRRLRHDNKEAGNSW